MRGIDYMSASSKKKLRKEQNAAAMTQKQQKEMKDAKALKNYTLTFVVVMVLVVAIVLGVTISNPINVALDQSTTAITIGDHVLTIPDLTFFYVDAIQNYKNEVKNLYYNQYPSYWQLFLGYDTYSPLDEQIFDEKEGTTWAHYFMDEAIKEATATYALIDLAAKENYTLSDEEKKDLDTYFNSLELFNDLDTYAKGIYSNSVTGEGFKAYYSARTLADSFYANYVSKLEYEDKDYREFEKGNYNVYSSFNFAIYGVSANKYLTGGTKSEDGKTTIYSDKEKDEAVQKALKDAQALMNKESVEKFDEAIKALEVNKDNKTAASTKNKNTFYNNISNKDVQTWVGNASRKEGDMTCITVNETVTLEDGTTTLRPAGYYVVFFQGREDHKYQSVDVRHILVKFAKANKDDKSTTYTLAEKETAKKKAEELLEQWKKGEKVDEDSFAALAKEKTEDTGSKSNGGLYEDIYKGQMVEAFENWCFDKDRKAGDTGLVETEYGYHIMYFVETNEMTYRDHMIKSDLVNEDAAEWRDELVEKATVVEGDLSRMEWDMITG
ncbi:MAG: hypothetical protein E7433_01435 [Ruminococcaceae bacterium]|nr:hypothetical protein [Oscillospiraceae bacterium]